MNDLQIRVFQHLSSGSSARREALNILTERGFFTDSDEGESQSKLAEFVERYGPRGSGQFCDDGIGRLYAAINLPIPGQAPGPQDDSLRLALRVNIHRVGLPDGTDEADEQVGEIANSIAAVVRLAQGEGWNVTGADLHDWYVD